MTKESGSLLDPSNLSSAVESLKIVPDFKVTFGRSSELSDSEWGQSYSSFYLSSDHTLLGQSESFRGAEERKAFDTESLDHIPGSHSSVFFSDLSEKMPSPPSLSVADLAAHSNQISNSESLVQSAYFKDWQENSERERKMISNSLSESEVDSESISLIESHSLSLINSSSASTSNQVSGLTSLSQERSESMEKSEQVYQSESLAAFQSQELLEANLASESIRDRMRSEESESHTLSLAVLESESSALLASTSQSISLQLSESTQKTLSKSTSLSESEFTRLSMIQSSSEREGLSLSLSTSDLDSEILARSELEMLSDQKSESLSLSSSETESTLSGREILDHMSQAESEPQVSDQENMESNLADLLDHIPGAPKAGLNSESSDRSDTSGDDKKINLDRIPDSISLSESLSGLESQSLSESAQASLLTYRHLSEEELMSHALIQEVLESEQESLLFSSSDSFYIWTSHSLSASEALFASVLEMEERSLSESFLASQERSEEESQSALLFRALLQEKSESAAQASRHSLSESEVESASLLDSSLQSLVLIGLGLASSSESLFTSLSNSLSDQAQSELTGLSTFLSESMSVVLEAHLLSGLDIDQDVDHLDLPDKI